MVEKLGMSLFFLLLLTIESMYLALVDWRKDERRSTSCKTKAVKIYNKSSHGRFDDHYCANNCRFGFNVYPVNFEKMIS